MLPIGKADSSRAVRFRDFSGDSLQLEASAFSNRAAAGCIEAEAQRIRLEVAERTDLHANVLHARETEAAPFLLD
jgi:hypothetical protein